jgi:Zn-dependent protease with chaperone function
VQADPTPPAQGPATQGPRAIWFDGRSARARPVHLSLRDRHLLLHPVDDCEAAAEEGLSLRHACRAITWPEPARHGRRVILLPDGGTLQLDDASAWDHWFRQQGLQTSWAARLAQSWQKSGLALVVLVAVALAAWRWGIPAAAQQLAHWVPAAALRSLDDAVMSELQGRGWLSPSELPATTQAGIEAALADMVASAYARDQAPHWRLAFHKLPGWMGPNAFALPGGRIVVSDALVGLLQQAPGQGPPPALLGVLAHELGHVRERHGVRLLVEAGATGVLLGWWMGDYSVVLAGAPAAMLQAAYARGHERAADAEALRLMQAAGLDPRAMASFFRALQPRLPERDGDSPAFGLSTHPADSERIEFFEAAGRPLQP